MHHDILEQLHALLAVATEREILLQTQLSQYRRGWKRLSIMSMSAEEMEKLKSFLSNSAKKRSKLPYGFAHVKLRELNNGDITYQTFNHYQFNFSEGVIKCVHLSKIPFYTRYIDF